MQFFTTEKIASGNQVPDKHLNVLLPIRQQLLYQKKTKQNKTKQKNKKTIQIFLKCYLSKLTC